MKHCGRINQWEIIKELHVHAKWRRQRMQVGGSDSFTGTTHETRSPGLQTDRNRNFKQHTFLGRQDFLCIFRKKGKERAYLRHRGLNESSSLSPPSPRFPIRNHSFRARQPRAAPAGAMATWPPTRVLCALPHPQVKQNKTKHTGRPTRGAEGPFLARGPPARRGESQRDDRPRTKLDRGHWPVRPHCLRSCSCTRARTASPRLRVWRARRKPGMEPLHVAGPALSIQPREAPPRGARALPSDAPRRIPARSRRQRTRPARSTGASGTPSSLSDSRFHSFRMCSACSPLVRRLDYAHHWFISTIDYAPGHTIDSAGLWGYRIQ